MTCKRAVLRRRADRNVAEAIDFYVRENSPRAALKFIDALEQALRDIEHHPAIGPTRYATELDLPGLRCWLEDQGLCASRVLHRARRLRRRLARTARQS